VALSTAEWDVLIVDFIAPIIFFMLEEDGTRKKLGYFDIDTYPRIICVAPLLSDLINFYINSQCVPYALQDFWQPKFLGQTVYMNLYMGLSKVFIFEAEALYQ